MIGVLAVLAILATIIASTTTRSLDIASANLESTNLSTYASSLLKSVTRNRSVPTAANVASAIATELGMDLKDVSTNARNNLRLFVYDPDLWIGTNKAGQGYVQTVAGAALKDPNDATLGVGLRPVHPRLVICSSLGANLPDLSGLSVNDFAIIWGTPAGTVPNVAAFGSGSWGGTTGGDDLRIQRLDLSPLFVHLVLYNYNYPAPTPGQYCIDSDRVGTLTNAVPSSNLYPNPNGIDSYFLQGTVLRLLKSTAAGGKVDADQVLSRDTSFAYVQDVWRSSINLGGAVDPRAAMMGSALWAAASMFMGSPYNTNAVNGAIPPVIVNDMSMFMTNYVNWANAGFPVSSGSPYYYTYTAAYSSQSTLYAAMQNLVGATWNANKGQFKINMTTYACTNPPSQ
jgi:type II secretory pathway pseudopilin PulG